uniref:Uncharacterized protein n=1 Tax=Timema bartmani TaxID=61472 RepID=A0A7R9I3W8_9NEOP|nr:unnamed protein product [Timema bartmani]
MEMVSNNTSHLKVASEANGLQKLISNFEFKFCLKFLYHVLSLTDILSKDLQSETLDILSLFPKVEALIPCLYSERNEETLNQIWNETEELWEKCISRGYSVARLFPNKKRKVLKNLTMVMARWAHHLFHLPQKNIYNFQRMATVKSNTSQGRAPPQIEGTYE